MSCRERDQRGRFVGFEEEGILIYRVYITATAEVVGTTDVTFLRSEMNVPDIPPTVLLDAPTTSSEVKPTHIPTGEVNDYQYLMGTRHVDQVDAPCIVHVPPEKRGTKSHAERGQRGRFVGFE